MGNSRVIYENMDPVEMLTSYLEGNTSYDEWEYPRYWHGYLAVIKPILLLFDYSDIRVFNMIIQGVLLIYIVTLMWGVKELCNSICGNYFCYESLYHIIFYAIFIS